MNPKKLYEEPRLQCTFVGEDVITTSDNFVVSEILGGDIFSGGNDFNPWAEVNG